MMFDFGQNPGQFPCQVFEMEPSPPFPADRAASNLAGTQGMGTQGMGTQGMGTQGMTPSGAAKGLTRGWLIERSGNRNESSWRFLQIGTGQWCGAEYATLFPLRRTAIAYAREFGLLVDQEAQIVLYEQGVPGE